MQYFPLKEANFLGFGLLENQDGTATNYVTLYFGLHRQILKALASLGQGVYRGNHKKEVTYLTTKLN